MAESAILVSMRIPSPVRSRRRRAARIPNAAIRPPIDVVRAKVGAGLSRLRIDRVQQRRVAEEVQLVGSLIGPRAGGCDGTLQHHTSNTNGTSK